MCVCVCGIISLENPLKIERKLCHSEQKQLESMHLKLVELEKLLHWNWISPQRYRLKMGQNFSIWFVLIDYIVLKLAKFSRTRLTRVYFGMMRSLISIIGSNRLQFICIIFLHHLLWYAVVCLLLQIELYALF